MKCRLLCAWTVADLRMTLAIRAAEAGTVAGRGQASAGEGGTMGDQGRAVEVQVAHLADRLVADYADTLPDSVVRSVVTHVYEAYAEARVTQFVPVLVDRAARAEL